jgi:ribonuclease Z
MLTAQVERDEPLVIIGPPKVREYIETTRRVLDMYINYPIEIREITKPGTPQEVYRGEGYSIRSFPLRHSKVCVGYSLVEEPRPGVFFPDKAVETGVPRGPMWGLLQSGQEVSLDNGTVVTPDMVMGEKRTGRKVSYVTDTTWRDSIPGEIADSDLLICESHVRRGSGRVGQGKKTSDGKTGRPSGQRGRWSQKDGTHPLQSPIYRSGTENTPGRMQRIFS